MSKTLGEDRVRVEFNPAKDDLVDQIKQKSAALINLIDTLKGDGSALLSGEQARLISLAQTSYEEAAMWAVKAATFNK